MGDRPGPQVATRSSLLQGVPCWASGTPSMRWPSLPAVLPESLGPSEPGFACKPGNGDERWDRQCGSPWEGHVWLSHGWAVLPLSPPRTSARAETASVDHKGSGALQTLGRVDPIGWHHGGQSMLWGWALAAPVSTRLPSQTHEPGRAASLRPLCVSWFQFCGTTLICMDLGTKSGKKRFSKGHSFEGAVLGPP